LNQRIFSQKHQLRRAFVEPIEFGLGTEPAWADRGKYIARAINGYAAVGAEKGNRSEIVGFTCGGPEANDRMKHRVGEDIIARFQWSGKGLLAKKEDEDAKYAQPVQVCVVHNSMVSKGSARVKVEGERGELDAPVCGALN
jgi:hypothetical protein